MRKILMTVLFIFVFALMFAHTQKTYAANVSDLEAWEVVNSWDGTKEWTTEGAKITLPGGVPDAWNRRAEILNNDTHGPLFTLSGGRTISFAFKIGMFDAAGNPIASTNNAGNALDLHVMNAANDQEIMHLRIWTDSAGATNGSHAYVLYPEAGNWGLSYDGATWIKGDATLSSSFFIQFSKERLFESYVGGSDDLTRLDNGNHDLLTHASRFNEVDQVWFRISGDNGFNANVDVIVTEINGQSLANDGVNFVDTVAPLIIDGQVSSSITMNDPYDIPVTAYDLLSEVTYRLEDLEGNIINPNGKVFTPTTDGSQSIKLVASDSDGNESEKVYTFNVVNNIEAPTLSNVPVIEDIHADYFHFITIAAPVVHETTGNYTLKLYIYHSSDLVEPYLVINVDNQNQFKFFILPQMALGTYTFIYEAENAGGIIRSDAQDVSISANAVFSNTFAKPRHVERAMADYVDEGLRVRSTTYTKFDLGVFDMRNGFNIKFQISDTTSNVLNMGSNGYAELVLSHPDNPNMFIAFRVWLDQQGAPDSPTNIFIKYPDQDMIDISEAGWIKNTVDDLNKHYHMAFDLDSYFIGERLGGMVPASTGAQHIEAFLEVLGGTELQASFVIHSHYASGAHQYYEALITEVNGQPLQSTNGIIDDVNDATLLVLSQVPLLSLQGEEIQIPIYLLDLFNENPTYDVTVITPMGEFTYTDRTGDFILLPSTLGTYTFRFTTQGSNQVVITLDDIVVTVKDKITLPTITLTTAYQSTYTLNSTLTILAATYSDDVVQSSKTIVIQLPDGTQQTVNVGSEITLNQTGIYTLTYTAADQANPTANVVTQTYSINVPDTLDPIVSITGLVDKALINEVIVIPTISIEDNSSVTILVTIEAPDGTRTNIGTQASNNQFTPDAVGTWKVIVRVTDLYENVTTVTYTIEVSEPASGLSTGLWVSIIVGSIGVLTLGVWFFIKKRKIV